MVTSAVILLFFLIVITYEIFSYKDFLKERVEGIGEIVARNISPALSFHDDEESLRVLSSLRGEEYITQITLYYADSTLAGAYPDKTDPIAIPMKKKGWIFKDPDSILYSLPVTDDFKTKTGHIVLNVSLSPLLTKLFLMTLVMGLSSLVLIVSGLMFLSKRTDKIVAPLKGLISTMAEVTKKKDYSHRLSGQDEGSNIEEINSLIKEFDLLLETVQKSENELRHINSNLELLVSQRTSELDLERQKTIQSARIASLGVMSAGIAHEINNPLAAIKISAHIISDQAKKENMDKELVRKMSLDINSLIERISKIIKGLRTFSRDSSKDPMDVIDIHAAIEDALIFCRKRYENGGVKLEMKVEPGVWFIQCHLNQISQVILNLLNNAYDALESQEEKWVRIESVPADADKLILSISDSGPGIPQETQKKLFDPFFTTKGVGKGMGIGLSISVGIMEAHKGKIFYDSYSSNTRFMLELPLAKVKA